MEKLLGEIIGLIKEISGVEISESQSLYDSANVDSFMLLNSVLPRLMDDYNIEIEADDLIPENFDTPSAIVSYIMKKKA